MYVRRLEMKDELFAGGEIRNTDASVHKQPRYREEHSASVVLSWCTL